MPFPRRIRQPAAPLPAFVYTGIDEFELVEKLREDAGCCHFVRRITCNNPDATDGLVQRHWPEDKPYTKENFHRDACPAKGGDESKCTAAKDGDGFIIRRGGFPHRNPRSSNILAVSRHVDIQHFDEGTCTKCAAKLEEGRQELVRRRKEDRDKRESKDLLTYKPLSGQFLGVSAEERIVPSCSRGRVRVLVW
jgi:hypothetical protein